MINYFSSSINISDTLMIFIIFVPFHLKIKHEIKACIKFGEIAEQGIILEFDKKFSFL